MKGICFQEPLFHGVVEGRITQFREIAKPQPSVSPNVSYRFDGICEEEGYYYLEELDDFGKFTEKYLNVGKPRYKAGEKVYLKEPYYKHPCFEIVYKHGFKGCGAFNIEAWKNKLSMPAKYARYFIEITDVRCDQLQCISDEDCLKEGVIHNQRNHITYEGIYSSDYYLIRECDIEYENPQQAYAALINKIHGNGTWESNPYVWVYDFKLIK